MRRTGNHRKALLPSAADGRADEIWRAVSEARAGHDRRRLWWLAKCAKDALCGWWYLRSDLSRITMSPVLDLGELLPERGSVKVKEAASLVLHSVTRNHRLSVKQLLLPMLTQVVYSKCLTADALGNWEINGETHWVPRFTFQRTTIKKQRIKVGIFAGVHGDEPAGILGLMDFVRELDEDPEMGRSFELFLYPLCNPTGYLAGTRASHSGQDLNREFWRGSTEPEVVALEAEIKDRVFDGIIALHSDDTCHGFY